MFKKYLNDFASHDPRPDILFCHSFRHVSGIYSDILPDILSGIYSGILFYLAFYPSVIQYVLTFFLAFYLTCLRVQAPSTASRAGDIEFGSRRHPLHPELPEEEKGEGEGRCCTFVKNLETLTWQVGNNINQYNI